MSQPARAVYRGLLGGYEELREVPIAHQTDIAFICITDDPDLKSDTWTIVVQEPRIPADLTRSSRALKILGHPCLDDYEQTLWLDNTVELKRPPDELFDTWLQDADVAAPSHSFRRSVLGEAEAVIDAGIDDYTRVYEQMTHYLRVFPQFVEENPHWTGMLARRHGAATSAMQTWWEHVLRYSRRDQLSFTPAMLWHDVRLRSVPLDHHSSAWHEWHGTRQRDVSRLSSGLREALRPPAGRIGQLEQALDEANRNLDAVVSERNELEERLRAAEQRRGREVLRARARRLLDKARRT
jgi:hypothetical protein